jgi:hypothetical protein
MAGVALYRGWQPRACTVGRRGAWVELPAIAGGGRRLLVRGRDGMAAASALPCSGAATIDQSWSALPSPGASGRHAPARPCVPASRWRHQCRRRHGVLGCSGKGASRAAARSGPVVSTGPRPQQAAAQARAGRVAPGARGQGGIRNRGKVHAPAAWVGRPGGRRARPFTTVKEPRAPPLSMSVTTRARKWPALPGAECWPATSQPSFPPAVGGCAASTCQPAVRLWLCAEPVCRPAGEERFFRKGIKKLKFEKGAGWEKLGKWVLPAL